MNLTPKQLRILQLVRDCRVTNGYSPTMQEIADELGISKVTVFEHVEALIKKGALTREKNKARSLSISDDAILPDRRRRSAFHSSVASPPATRSRSISRAIASISSRRLDRASASRAAPSRSRSRATRCRTRGFSTATTS